MEVAGTSMQRATVIDSPSLPLLRTTGRVRSERDALRAVVGTENAVALRGTGDVVPVERFDRALQRAREAGIH